MFELLGEFTVLLAALRFEFGHFLLHGAQRLLHRGKGLQHAGLALVTIDLGLGIRPVVFDDLAVLRPQRVDLFAEGPCPGLHGGVIGDESRLDCALVSLQLGQGGAVLGLDHSRVELALSTARDQYADREAEGCPDGYADDEYEEWIHSRSVPVPTDNPGTAGTNARESPWAAGTIVKA